MEANELRIGNIISDGFMRYKVAEISFGIIKGFSTLDGKNVYPDTLYSLNIGNLQGIPLTEEILLKCGFKPFVNDFSKKGIIIHNRKRGFIIRKSIPQLEYLHQLQNLYFALTGKELEIEQ